MERHDFPSGRKWTLLSSPNAALNNATVRMSPNERRAVWCVATEQESGVASPPRLRSGRKRHRSTTPANDSLAYLLILRPFLIYTPGVYRQCRSGIFFFFMGTLCSAIAENSAAERLTVTRLWEVSLGKYDNGCLFIVIEICKPASQNGAHPPPQKLWLRAPGSKTSTQIQIRTASSATQPPCSCGLCCACTCAYVHFFFLLSSKADVLPNIQSTQCSIKSFPLNSFINPHCGGLLCNNKENLSVAASL